MYKPDIKYRMFYNACSTTLIIVTPVCCFNSYTIDMQCSAIDVNNNVCPMSTKYPEITLNLQYDDKN